nr:MAG TPA: hypothetical protein [Bacteriophage sp.]
MFYNCSIRFQSCIKKLIIDIIFDYSSIVFISCNNVLVSLRRL